jgi:hypothetical protein
MLKSTRLRLFIHGYREVILGSNLDIVNVTPKEHDAYEEGKQAARDDLAKRIDSPFNSNPEVRP